MWSVMNRRRKTLVLAGGEYGYDWFVPRLAMTLMPDLVTRHRYKEAWVIAMQEAEAIADDWAAKKDSQEK